ncbi:putative F420-0 ABC transporter substrate-binding protein [Sanguibacter sp. A247]|uniref:putative F420-0 ABC transporter substrate-binding protein n=1 Tax=unclassified Sanguibacter TaxID=2645534 RepID=UPI003FD82B06
MPRSRHLPSSTTPLIALVAASVAALALAGCTSSDTQAAAPGATTAGSPVTSASATAYPLTVDNCGTTVTFTQRPERILTIKSATTEMVLALGAGDSIIATAYPDGPAPQPWTAQAAALPVLADRVPSREIVLAAEPDLVYAGWESNFSAEGVGERPGLEKLGVRTLVAPSACKSAPYAPNPLTFDAVFDEIAQVGTILDRGAEAARLIATQRAQLDSVTPDERNLSALWFSSGSDTPYVGGGTGAPQLIMQTAGLTNIGAEIDDAWGPLSWEAIAAADPDVIVLVDSPWNSAEKKKALLASGAVTSELRAVRAGAYVVVPFPATEAGVRTVAAAEQVAADVRTLELTAP